MPLTIPTGVAEIVFRFSLAGDSDVMTVALGVVPDDASDPQSVADDSYTVMAAWVAAAWGSDYAIVGTSVTSNDGGTFVEAEHNQVTAGVGATNHPVQNTAMLVRKVTGIAGRANRGRFYFPPGRLAEVDVNNVGLIDSVDAATIQGELDDLYTDLVATTSILSLVVLHSEIPPGTPSVLAPTPISSFALDSVVATQRRRLR